MAEFCNNYEEWGFPEVDIHVYTIHRKLKKGAFARVLCEACGLLAIKKEDTGALKVAYSKQITWEDYTPNKK